MEQAAFTIRMNNDLKGQFEQMCENFGMSMSTAINLFARAVIKQKRIPFDIEYNSDANLLRAKNISESLRKEAESNGTANMSLDEINKEIYGR